MKKYPHIISKLFNEPLLITRARHQMLCNVVEAHMAKVEAGDGEDAPGAPEYMAVEQTVIIPVHGVLGKHL